jgi:hypothetical protein
MTRGPVSEIALEEALPIAKLRGRIFFLRPDPECPCDFQILNNREDVFVRVKRSRCLYCSLAEMEALYRESIQKLRLIPLSASVQRELWVCSRYGRWRFFRITDTGMEEIAVPAV